MAKVQQWAEARIRERLDPGQRVLEIGCGSGDVARALYARGFQIECADRSPHHGGLEGVPYTDAVDLNGAIPFPDASFDVVYSLEVVEHLLNPFNAFREYARILKGGGELILTLPNFWGARPRWRFLWRGLVNRSKVNDEEALRMFRDLYPPHINTMPWASMKFGLEAFGFELDELVGHRAKPWKDVVTVPLVALIWLVGRVLPGPPEVREVNRWSVLFGKHVYLRLHKRERP